MTVTMVHGSDLYEWENATDYFVDDHQLLHVVIQHPGVNGLQQRVACHRHWDYVYIGDQHDRADLRSVKE